MKNYLISILFVLLTGDVIAIESHFVKHDVAISYDKERIAYSVYGSGDRTLVFIHGWSCDSRYWVNQLQTFSDKYKVITIDLSGHGNSSSNRNNYTIRSFAKDIQAVVEKEKKGNVVLIGHSMGGAVIASAVQLLPSKVQGIIGVDTLKDISLTMSQEGIDAALKPFIENYKETVQSFVASLFILETNKKLKTWISNDMASASKYVAISALRGFMVQFKTGEFATKFESFNIPVITINSKFRPTNEEGNKKQIKDYQPIYIEGTGHFPMLERPQEFNSLLKKALYSLR